MANLAGSVRQGPQQNTDHGPGAQGIFEALRKLTEEYARYFPNKNAPPVISSVRLMGRRLSDIARAELDFNGSRTKIYVKVHKSLKSSPERVRKARLEFDTLSYLYEKFRTVPSCSVTKPIAFFPLDSLGVAYDITTREKKERAIRELKGELARQPRMEWEGILRELRARSKADPTFLRGKMLTWKQVKEMWQGGMHFGAHTVSHPLLPSLPLKEAREEIVASKAELEARLKGPVSHFSYPNPGGGVHWDAAVKRLVADSGYLTAVTSRQGYVTGEDDRFELRRVAVLRKPWGMPWDLEREALARSLWRNSKKMETRNVPSR